MKKLIKPRTKKVGLLPGTPVLIGEKKVEKSKINLLNYDEKYFEEKEIIDLEECVLYKNKSSISWINVEGIHDVEILNKIGKIFDIHPLALEDILNTDQRPKVEGFNKNIYVVLKMLSYAKDKEIISEQVSLILGSNYVISFQEGIEGDVFNPIRDRIRNNKGFIRKERSDYLAYSLIDIIVDNYFIILEQISEDIEHFEELLIKEPVPRTMIQIHNLKREMIFLRKSVWPLREVVNNLQKVESNLIYDLTRLHLRDVYDHSVQIIDTIESFRDIVGGMLEIYLTNISNKTNTVMKVLTIIATIFMPPTFIVGIYGMNFKYMPELDYKWGYPLVLMLNLLVVIFMLFYFKKKRWI